jgi:hypothetical protein
MELRQVTFTGADDRTNPADLAALSREYPFVEWAVMFSGSRTGRESRFPSLGQLERIGDLNANLAVHLNDRLARDAASGDGYPVEAVLQFVRGARRVQINLFREVDHYPDLFRHLRDERRAPEVEFIVQVYGFDSPVATAARHVSGTGRVTFLHDVSGGRGVVGRFEPPVNDDYVGFAGGIHAGNVEEKLQEIAALGHANPFWIDMETGVRTEDRFDLDKVERVLRLVRPFISPPSPPSSAVPPPRTP